MKTNELSSKTGARINRIQKVSANLKTFFLFVAGGSVAASLGPFVSHAGLVSLGAHQLVESGIHLTWAAGYWFAYKLFSAYSRGDLFSAGIVCNLRRMGWVGILLGIEKSVSTFIFSFAAGSVPWWTQATVMPFLFFSVLPGFAILCIAWIMDEGRKIQEEQELTV